MKFDLFVIFFYCKFWFCFAFFFKKKNNKGGNLEIVNFLLEKGATRDFSRAFPAACGVCIFRFIFVFLLHGFQNETYFTGWKYENCQNVPRDGRRFNWFICQSWQFACLSGISSMHYLLLFQCVLIWN